MANKQTEPEDIVKLKPVAGLRAGVYLTVIYSIILLVVCFFVLIYPGIKNTGSVIVFKSEPEGAALRIDGVYMGTSGDKIFAFKGRHTLTAVLPGFEEISQEHEIPGRIFGSLFFPRPYRVEFTLKPRDSASAFAMAAGDFAEWTFGGEPTVSWQVPLSLSEGAYRTGPANDPASKDILIAASRFTVTRGALRDLIRAKMLLDNSGLSPSPASIAGSVSDILQFLSDNPGSAAWLTELLPPESSAVVRASRWYNAGFTPPPIPASEQGRKMEIAGLLFTEIPEKGIYISENPVTKTIFDSVVINRNSYTQIFSSLPGGLQDPVTVVTWHEAQEFCQWLTGELPPSMTGIYEARLPTEDEWEIAFLKGGIQPDSGLWEWAYDPYSPLQFIKAQGWAVNAVSSPEKVIRSPENRSSLPPEFASPAVTFRPVIALRN